jgi:hypothetical protein
MVPGVEGVPEVNGPEAALTRLGRPPLLAPPSPSTPDAEGRAGGRPEFEQVAGGS